MKKWRCAVCGYEMESETRPDGCPVCGAGREAMEPVEEAGETPDAAVAAAPVTAWRCVICNYVHEGSEPPDICPICNAPKEKFEPYTMPEPATDSATAAGAPPEAPGADPAPSRSGEDRDTPPTGLMETISPLLEVLDAKVHKHHLHPISVHMPNGIIPVAFFFAAIGWLFHAPGFEMAAHYNLTMVFLALPLVIYSGFVVWRDRYNQAMTKVFKIKIACAAAVTASVSILVIWKSFDPAAGGFLFMLFQLVAVVATGVAGHYGGKLVFGTRK